MKTLIRPRALLSIVRTKASKTEPISSGDRICSNIKIGVFSSHRDVKVAIEELLEAGIQSALLTIVARKWQEHNWLSDLAIYNYFNEQLFGTNLVCQHFFQKLFRQGKYLLLVSTDIKDAKRIGAIIGRRRGHAEVWYFKNNVLEKIA